MRFCSLLLLALAVGTVAAVDTLGGSHQWDSIVDLADSKNDTTIVWSLIQAAGLESALDESNFTATVFLPTDEYLSAAADSIDTDDVELLTKVLKYHVVPGFAYTLDELTDGMVLQTLVEGPEGQLMVSTSVGAKKPKLLTTSGQEIPIYQYDVVAGDAIVHTIKGVLMPGEMPLGAQPPSTA